MKRTEKTLAVYPSILTDNLSLAASQLQLASRASVDIVQLDIIDGFYADNLTLTPADYATLDFGEVQADFHLMVEEPLDFVYEILDHKDYLPVRAIVAQVEKMSNQFAFVQFVRDNNYQVGLSLDLYTPMEAIDPQIFANLDLIQVMGIEAGFQGQEFLGQSIELIQQLVDLRFKQNLNFHLVADGGIKLDLVEKLVALGVDGVAVGSALWPASDFKQEYDKFVSVN